MAQSGDRPEDMWRRGRPPDQSFEPEHELYYRVKQSHLVGDRVEVLGVQNPPFQDFPFSVNWSKYSRPGWVLIPPAASEEPFFVGFSVAAIRVDALPAGVQGVTLKPEHRPEDDNYSHSEVFPTSPPDRPTRKKLRQMLADRLRLVPASELD